MDAQSWIDSAVLKQLARTRALYGASCCNTHFDRSAQGNASMRKRISRARVHTLHVPNQVDKAG
eukprot:4998509-Amphidinium_carterae.1